MGINHFNVSAFQQVCVIMHELHNWSSQSQMITLGDSIAKSSLIPIGLPTIQFLIPHNMQMEG